VLGDYCHGKGMGMEVSFCILAPLLLLLAAWPFEKRIKERGLFKEIIIIIFLK